MWKGRPAVKRRVEILLEDLITWGKKKVPGFEISRCQWFIFLEEQTSRSIYWFIQYLLKETWRGASSFSCQTLRVSKMSQQRGKCVEWEGWLNWCVRCPFHPFMCGMGAIFSLSGWVRTVPIPVIGPPNAQCCAPQITILSNISRSRTFPFSMIVSYGLS